MKHYIARATVLGVIIIAVSAFALSFDALQQLALQHGVSPKLAWMFPVSLDLAILVYSLASILRRWQGLCAKMEISFVIVSTVISVVLNTCSSSDNVTLNMVLNFVVHALPPLFMAAAIEAATRLISAPVEIRSARSKKGAVTRRRRNKASVGVSA